MIRPASQLQHLAEKLAGAGSGEPIRIRGASIEAQALILSRALLLPGATESKRCLVVVPDEDTAVQLRDSLALLAGSASLETLHLPAFESSPWSSVSPSIRVRLQRAAVLHHVHSAEGVSARPIVLLASLPALLQAGMPKVVFESHRLILKTGESVAGRDQLAERLARAGYLRCDPVEDPGTFAVRGEIVDVYPPGAPHPIRIELFDTEIERIRPFDAATQRTIGDHALDRIDIGPAREALLTGDTVGRLRERLKACADERGIPRKVRDPVLHSIAENVQLDVADYWAPWIYGRTVTALEHLNSEWRVVWSDELDVLQSWDRFEAEAREKDERYRADPEKTRILPTASEILGIADSALADLKARSWTAFDRLALASAEDLVRSGTRQSEEEEEDETPGSRSIRVRTTTPGQLLLSRTTGADAQAHFAAAADLLLKWKELDYTIIIYSRVRSRLERARQLLAEHGLSAGEPMDGAPLPTAGGDWTPGVFLAAGSLEGGLVWPSARIAFLSERELFPFEGKKNSKRGRGRSAERSPDSVESGSASRDWAGLQALGDLSLDDAIVHVDHGVGRYQGIVRLSLGGAPMDFLLLQYGGGDKLYVPVYRLNSIQKYVGSGESVPLDRLGSQSFQKQKEKVREAVRTLAIDLVRLYAERSLQHGVRFSPPDEQYALFEENFPFDETPDQLKAIEKTLEDLESGRPMDRLVCGDVGYGKTEVAIRAAFRAVSEGHQVAVLAPTTILARQHELSFRERMDGHAIRIESLTRFKSPKEQKASIEDAAAGKVDILIGTHRLLSKDVSFQSLGMVIVDEEQRFGVEHKERLKAMRVDTHILTLTATPIPRTLHMALSGLRDISIINTPPVDRLPIRTFVAQFDEALITQAIRNELQRGGQVFFLHNRVQTIEEIAAKLREWVPEASVGIGHGQMTERQLEKAMESFYSGATNVLVCTAIIESGLDIPSANTIIVNRADHFGLSQLYQIRGRVGRGQNRAYAYLLLPAEGAITEDARKRLEVLQKFVELGSGFSIASHDLELRGGGDLLGAQQSGHIASVGFELYTELLEEAIRDLKAEHSRTSADGSRDGAGTLGEGRTREPEIKTPFPAFLPESYIPEIHQRLSLYRRLSAARTEQEMASLETELVDRFGSLPAEAENLLWILRIKQVLQACGIESLAAGPERISLQAGAASTVNPDRLIAVSASRPDRLQLLPDSRLAATLRAGSPRELYFGVERLLRELGGLDSADSSSKN